MFKDLDKFFGDQLRSVKFLQTIADKAVEQIVKKTRLGYGVPSEGANQQKLRKLADSTIKKRKRLPLHSSTTPSTSNLTETGKMLEGIKYEISNSRITIFIDGEENQRKALWAYELDRPFFALSKANTSELRRMIHDGLASEFNKRRR